MPTPTPTPLLSAAAIAAMVGEHKVHDFNPNAIRHSRSLGDATGLTQIGVHLVTIQPGHDTTAYHRHLFEEEFVYVLSGQGRAEIDEQFHALAAGDFLGFARNGAAHGITNTGSEPLICLMGGQRLEQDVCDYPHAKKRLYINGAQEDLVEFAHIQT